MSLISASVGHGGRNRRPDVRVVEFLLNRAMTATHLDRTGPQPDGSIVISAIAADGVVDASTVTAIRDFQSRVCGFRRPDGRVDPSGRTIHDLIGVFVRDGGLVPMDLRQAIPRIRPRSRIFRRPGTIGGVVQAGETAAGLDGSRLILSINEQETIFLLLDHSGPGDDFQGLDPLRGRVGAIYVQRTPAFLDESDTMIHRNLAQHLEQGVARLQDFQVSMTLGALSAISTGVAVALTAGQATLFVIEHRQLLAACLAFLRVYVRVRRILKARAPHLCEKIEAALLKGVGRAALIAVGVFGDDVFEHVDDAADTPDALGKILGAMAGTAGAALSGRFTVVGAVLAVVKTLLVRAVLTVGGAIPITATEKLSSAREIVRHFQSSGVPTTLADGERIVQEILAHPVEIRGAIEDLAQAAVVIRATSN